MPVPAVPTILGGIEVEIVDGDGNWVQKRYRAAELPEVLARDRDVFRAEAVIITQFCRDWRSWPDDRVWMLEGEPDPGSDPYDLAKVAAIVRGLCERWNHPTPAWIEGVRAPTDILLFLDNKGPVHPGWERNIRKAAPPRLRGAWRLLRSGHVGPQKDVFAPIAAEMRAAGVVTAADSPPIPPWEQNHDRVGC